MFQLNDLIIYGNNGVCRVEEISTPRFPNSPPDRLYYSLTPINKKGVIYVPVDSKMFMRPIITAEEVQALLQELPDLPAVPYYNGTVQLLIAHYEEVFKGYSCRDLLLIIRSIFAKRAEVEAQGRHLGQVDQRYLKRAQELLYSEIAAALGISVAEVPALIEQ